MKPHERIVFALDVPNIIEAGYFVSLLQEHVGIFKVGLELFIAGGSNFIKAIKQPVMLDLKLHDIPITVERAVYQAAELGVKFLTIHIQQRETMHLAVKAAEKSGLQLLAVSVLTSMVSMDLFEINGDLKNTLKQVFMRRAQLAYEEGITGFIASPQEVKSLRSAYPSATIVVPSIRSNSDKLNNDDQKRTGSTRQVITDGADYLVVGRPIKDASDPVYAANCLAKYISNY